MIQRETLLNYYISIDLNGVQATTAILHKFKLKLNQAMYTLYYEHKKNEIFGSSAQNTQTIQEYFTRRQILKLTANQTRDLPVFACKKQLVSILPRVLVTPIDRTTITLATLGGSPGSRYCRRFAGGTNLRLYVYVNP